MKPNDDSFGPTLAQNGYRREYPSVDSYAASIIKVITLRRRGNAPLGFSIRGGWEHGTGVFVSEVTPGSIAMKQGLRIGDQIVRINGFSIHRAIHVEVLSLLKTCPGIVLKIKRVGILPVKERDKDPVTWKIVEPPPSVHEQVPHSRVNGSNLENIICKVEISVPGSASLGCSIAKGPPELPGIYMCTVKASGVADRAGLQVGDQILEMNGTTFHHDLQLSEAVTLMKSAKDIRLTVKKLAGIGLFLDNTSSSHTSSNKNDDCISTTRSLSDGLSTTIKDHEFSGSCSSKSSSFQSSVSSDSEKDYSISEESAFDGIPKSRNHSKWPNNNRHHHHKKNPSTSTTEDDSWILEEKRNLEEEKRKLFEEKRRLEEEKRKLELEKTSSSSSSSQMTSLEDQSSRDNTFLNELQKAAAKMQTREMKEPSKNGLNGNDGGRVKKCKEDDEIKRMQHEMLMEEFREAHRKMFGAHAVFNMPGKKEDKGLSPVAPTKEFSKLTIRQKKLPPPPPPKIAETNNNKECQKITINGHIPDNNSKQTIDAPEIDDSVHRVQEIIKAKEKTISATTAAPPTTNGIKITVSDRGRPDRGIFSVPVKPQKSGALVEVTPWNTRL